MEKIIFGDTFKKVFTKIFNIPKVIVDDPVFRLHYKFTGLALLIASIMVSGYQFFGNPIMCIQRDDVPEALLNTYCWIEGTFTLPKSLMKKVGSQVVYPGVDNYQIGDEVIEHAYYQWVCFVLFLQAAMICFPYFLWRTLEGGKMKDLVQEMQKLCVKEPEKCYRRLSAYFKWHRKKYGHRQYAFYFMLCELLNFAIVVCQICLVDRFLGGQFSNYGTEVVSFVNQEQQDRIDPMIKVFPRITKCTFHKFGSSGDVQRHDALCLLPLNIINEKIFVTMWFWLVILAVMGAILLIYRVSLLYLKHARFMLLKNVVGLVPDDLLKPLNTSYADWFVLYMLADNITNLHFYEFVRELNKPPEQVRRELEEEKRKELEKKMEEMQTMWKELQEMKGQRQPEERGQEENLVEFPDEEEKGIPMKRFPRQPSTAEYDPLLDDTTIV